VLVVGRNDTSRNYMSGGVYALNRFPSQFVRLQADPGFVPKLVHEIIRWQTPLAYMRRIATRDTVLNGQFIRKGDKLVMWYASANRDDRVFEDPDDFVIDRQKARRHPSFGIGTHPCTGSRHAEMPAADPVGGRPAPASPTSRSSRSRRTCSPTSCAATPR